MRRTPLRVLFVIRSLGVGGAERQLIVLVAGLRSRAAFDVAAMTLYDDGALRDHAVTAGIPLLSMRKRHRWDLFTPLWRGLRHVRRFKPDVIHGYMPVGNLLALLLGMVARCRVVWGIRATHVDHQAYDWLNALSLKLAALASRRADLIICNSGSGARDHVADGYPADRTIVIPNGIDTGRFFPMREEGAHFRESWRIGEHTLVVGAVGRLDPMKDHPTLLRAIALLCKRLSSQPDPVRVVCIGSGDPAYVGRLAALAAELGIAEVVTWIPHVDAPERVYNAFDVLVMSSAFGEGFPNVVAEALCCEVPCVVTDVGDARALVRESGIAVPARDHAALADALYRMLTMPRADRHALGAMGRRRVVEQFGTDQLVGATADALASTVLR